jgi:hypothetical protein
MHARIFQRYGITARAPVKHQALAEDLDGQEPIFEFGIECRYIPRIAQEHVVSSHYEGDIGSAAEAPSRRAM